MKKILSFCILFLMIMMLGSCTLKEEKTSNIDKYPEYLGQVAYAEEYMPNIEQCGNYSSMLATYKKSGVIIFVTDTVGLFLSYNEDEYYEQKEEMLSSFEFFYPEGFSVKLPANFVW